MKKIIPGFLISLLTVSCDKGKTAERFLPEPDHHVQENIQKNKNTVRERFPAPDGYGWIKSQPGSFSYFIEHFTLKPYGSPILKYDGTQIATQHLHEAVFDIDTGTKDLQQCADAVIRLRAEYLFKTGKSDEIRFHFTSGDLLSWTAYRSGIRAFVNGNSVSFRKTAAYDDSYGNFRNYLDLIFNYAGTISLNRETKPVIKTQDLKAGDFLITPGSPGHVIFIAGVSSNSKGERLFLLGEGFTPAQSIHILSNPFASEISPWYSLRTDDPETKTARYIFKPSNFRKF